jgi:GNAT superfamily N-acetyltransferase
MCISFLPPEKRLIASTFCQAEYMITYHVASIEHTKEAEALLTEYLGPQPLGIIEDLVKGHLVLLALDNEKLIGAATFAIYKDINQVLIEEQAHLAGELDLQAPVGVLKSAVVLPEYQGQSVGRHLLQRGEAWLAARCKTGFASAWIYPDGSVPAQKIVQELGYSQRLIAKDYWGPHSIVHQIPCPDCGIPCTCSCMLFTKEY